VARKNLGSKKKDAKKKFNKRKSPSAAHALGITLQLKKKKEAEKSSPESRLSWWKVESRKGTRATCIGNNKK